MDTQQNKTQKNYVWVWFDPDSSEIIGLYRDIETLKAEAQEIVKNLNLTWVEQEDGDWWATDISNIGEIVAYQQEVK